VAPELHVPKAVNAGGEGGSEPTAPAAVPNGSAMLWIDWVSPPPLKNAALHRDPGAALGRDRRTTHSIA
jgi:hypothetical protein